MSDAVVGRLRDATQRWLFRPAPGPLARGLALGTAAWTRRAAARPAPAPAHRPTIIVGGLAVGGAGRTPLVEWLARALHAEGWRVAVVAHGYRGDAAVASRLDAPDGRRGDEAAALRRALPLAIPVYVGPRRADALALAADADVVLLDGGFQDRSVPATARIAIIDATAPRAVLPAGPLREPLEALGRADAVWLHRVDEPGAAPLPAPWRPAVESQVAVRAVHLPGGAVVGPDWLRGRAVRPLCGVARPGSFRATLAGAGAALLPGHERADHHRFTAAELARCAAQGGTWVTTTKDRERLPAGWPAAVVEVELAVVAGDVERVLALCRP